jgi:hypothetical protein
LKRTKFGKIFFWYQKKRLAAYLIWHIRKEAFAERVE